MKKGIAISTVAALASVLAAGLLSGCSSSAGISGSVTATEVAPGVYEYSEFVVVNNPSLADDIQIVKMYTDFVGDLMRATVTLVSKESDTQSVLYNFSWFDGQGVELDAGSTPWLNLVLYGNDAVTVQGVAPNPSARTFKLKLRTE
ncbi:MAG TPA: YcfL family protein [bacterium]|nr:YcfL family protein [bacterium]HPQ65310.1 YcfL family protein [bacterium]